MNSIVARVVLFSLVFLLPLIVVAQPDDSLHDIDLTAHDPETGEALPTQDGKAPIDGTPGDGIRDHFNYLVVITNIPTADPGPLEETGRLKLVVGAWGDNHPTYGEGMPDMILGEKVVDDIHYQEDVAFIRGRIDLSSDTEFGQMLRYVGRLDLPSGRAATFEHDVTVGCLCPRSGSWTATNYPGTMVCTGTFNSTLPLGGNTQTGADLGVYDGCRTIQYTNFDEEYADVVMQRVPGECGYEGEAQGIPMESSFNFDVQNEEFLIGSLRLTVAQQGATCIMTRDFEVRFND